MPNLLSFLAVPMLLSLNGWIWSESPNRRAACTERAGNDVFPLSKNPNITLFRILHLTYKGYLCE